MTDVKLFRRGQTRAFFLPSVADIEAPTVAEFGAGTELTAAINDISGFNRTTTTIPTPTLDTTFTGSIGGEQTAPDSSIKFYLYKTANPLRSTLAEGVVGFIAWVDEKPSGSIAAADIVDVYPVQVNSTPKSREMGNVPALWDAMMSITDLPAEDVAVAA